MASVLITRPRASTEHLAQHIQGLGYEPVIEPLLSIAALHEDLPPGLKFDAVMITSGNAVTALEGREGGIPPLLGLPCYCVGPRTEAKAKEFGFSLTESSSSDGVELAHLIAGKFKKPGSVLHIAGKNIDRKADHELRHQGFTVTVWPVYEAHPVIAFSPPVLQRFRTRNIDAVIAYSPRTARVLLKLITDNALGSCCTSIAAICLSQSVADILKPVGWRHIAAPPLPTEDGVVACLQKACPVKL
jgi:uroporphyrinogen-III synthase